MVDIQIIFNIIFRLSECIYTFVAALIKLKKNTIKIKYILILFRNIIKTILT